MPSIAGIFTDLQRRGVLRVAGIYCVAAWVISEVAISLEEPLGLPDWLDTSIVIVLAMGFPIALLLAYAFNLTPEGIRRHRGEEPGNTLAPAVAGTVFIALSITLAGAWSAMSMIEITSYLAEGERDKALQALDDWHRELPNANPADGFWPEPFPQAVIDRVEEPLRSRLQGKNLPEGIMIVMQDLGWTPPLAKS